MEEYKSNLSDYLPLTALGVADYNTIQRGKLQDFATNQLYNRGVTPGSALDNLYRERSPENWNKFKQVFDRYNKYSNYKKNKSIMKSVSKILGSLGKKSLPIILMYEMLQQPLGE